MSISRRSFLAAGSAAVLLAGCGRSPEPPKVVRVEDDFRVSLFPSKPRKPQVDPSYIHIRRMRYTGSLPMGTLIVNEEAKKLYLIEGNGYALEYPVGLGRQWKSEDFEDVYAARKRHMPPWWPTARMRRENPSLPRQVAGGAANNPLGLWAIYLYKATRDKFNRRVGYDTILRIHGTDAAGRRTIGTNASSGCIRMLNEHVEHLYKRLHIMGRPSDPIGKPKIVVAPQGLLTRGMDYESAVVVRPYERPPAPAQVGMMPSNSIR